MIIRKGSDGELTLISQTDHSRFVGLLAAHWGNEQFTALRPFESVVRAATFHDFGYLNWEPDPSIDPHSGEPYEFRKLPFSDRQLNSYQWCIDWISSIDAYSGMLVSMHRTGLWKQRYDKIEHPGNYNVRALHPEIQEFIARNEPCQAEERARHDQDEVWTNYELLQVWDLLGLYFGCQEPNNDYMEPVPTGYGAGKNYMRLTMTPVGSRQVQFDPYPFDVHPLTLPLACKRVRQASFLDTAAFRQAYFKAPIELIEYQLV